MTEEQTQALIEAAKQGMENAYGLSQGAVRYGAAVLAETGNVYAAGQYKAETRQVSLHAEQAALVHAASHGDHRILAIAIVSNEDPEGNAFTNPCGICKQMLYESSWVADLPMKVILANLKGRFAIRLLDEFIVFPWPAPKSRS